MWDQDDIYAVARYRSFAIGSESDDFKLVVDGYMPPLNSAMDAKDSLSASNGSAFSAYHR